ncbi:MAG: 50S ribosomal protein L24 [Acidobacteria bacterium]|nr:50S ribosomal protein L24 [Acidobacteriota bacterium]
MARQTAKVSRRKAPGGVKIRLRVDLKKNDTVKVIAGRDKGKTGRVLDVDREKGRVLVEHVGMVKRHTRPNPAKQIKGGIAERESPVAASNVMIVCPGCHKTVRVAHKVELAGEKNRRTRVCRKCGAALDKKS